VAEVAEQEPAALTHIIAGASADPTVVTPANSVADVQGEACNGQSVS